MTIVDEFDAMHHSVKRWAREGGIDVDERTLVLSSAILMIFDIERRGWSNRMEEMQRAQRIAQAARDAVIKELSP